MNVYGRTSIGEFLGDNVVYRNLEPVDDRLPTLDHLRADLGLSPGRVPARTSRITPVSSSRSCRRPGRSPDRSSRSSA